MAEYSFTMLWRVAARMTPVWWIVAVPEAWPQWWQGVLAVRRVTVGDASGVGRVYQYVFRGKLTGMGLWQLSEQDEVTQSAMTGMCVLARRG